MTDPSLEQSVRRAAASSAADTTHLTVFSHRVRLTVREGTDPDQPPLLLLNGIGARLELLQPFVDELDERIPVIRFDIPGVGGSAPPLLPYRFSGMAALAHRLVKRLGYERCDVLGISWGGGLAQQFAWQYPRFARRVVLCATATGALMVPAHPRILSKMVTPHRYRDPDYAREIAAQLYGGKMRDNSESAGVLLGARPGIGTTWGYVCQLMAGSGWTSLAALPFIRQSTLVLAGADDPIIPLVNARLMTRLLPHARLHVYDDGHLGLVTSASETGPLVSDFVLA